jgi:Tfp pilus assembly protein PilF
MRRALSLATNLFPVWVLMGGAQALLHPAWVTWFSGSFITWGLAVIMLGMGITLSADDFSGGGQAKLRPWRDAGEGAFCRPAGCDFRDFSFGHRQPAGRHLAVETGAPPDTRNYFVVERRFWWLPSNPPNMEPITAAKGRTADEMCDKGRWREVLAFAQKWREESATDHRAHYYLGRGWSGMGQFARAEAAYRQALAMDPTDFELWNELTELLFKKMRRLAEGIQCLEQALQTNPQHKLGWLHLATMTGRMGHHQRALECADQALALDPKLVEAYLSKAAAARALGKMDLVKDICHELAALEPESFRRAS